VNDNQNYQSTLRARIEDLKATLKISNINWGAWEREFIESVSKKLDQQIINVSPAQYKKIYDLWEKI